MVDDDGSIRNLVTSMLSHAGYECRSVGSGQDALHVLQTDGQYDLLLSDLAMDGMNGIDLLDRVRRLEPQTPVVMVTAIHDLSVALDAIRKGAYDYLLKPFEREQLLATVHRALETQRLQRQLLSYQTKLETLI